METKLKLPKKLLSMFLAVLMAFSCFSLVLPELVPGAQAAVDAATVKTLVSKAASKTASSNTNNTATFTNDDGTVLAAADAVFDYAVNSVRKTGTTGSPNSSDALCAKVLSNLGYSASSKEGVFITAILNPNGTAAHGYDSRGSYTASGSFNNSSQGDRSSGSNVSYNGNVSNSFTKKVVVEVNLVNYLLTFDTIAAIPASFPLKVTYSFPHTYSTSVSWSDRNTSYETGSGCDKTTVTQWTHDWTSYKWNYMSSNPTRTVNSTNTTAKSDLQGYADYFTAERLATTAADLLDKSVAELNAMLEEVETKWNALAGDTGYGSAVANKFFNYTAISNYVAEVEFAAQVVNAQPTMKIVLDLMKKGYDKNDIDEMNEDYAKGLEAYNVFKDYDEDIFEFVVDNYDGYDGFTKAGAAAYIDTLDYDIQFYNLTEFKNDVDATIANKSPLLADPLNETDITNGELSAIIGQVGGYFATIAPYRDDVEAAVFTEGTDYIIEYRDAAQLKLDSRGVQANFDTYWEYFLPLIYAPNLADLTKEELKTRYDADTAEQAKLNKTYGENESLIGADLTKTIYTIEYTIGDKTQNTLPQAVADYISRLGGVIRAKNNAQLDNVAQFRDKDHPNEVNFENFVGLKTAIDAVDTDFYNYALSKGLVSAEYQALYNSLSTLLANYKTFVESGGMSAFKQHHYHDANGVYVVRLAGDQGVENDYPNDIAREGAEENYVVDVAAVDDTIAKLDGFLVSQDFCSLVGFKNEETGAPYDTLSDAIDNIIQTMLFTDDLVNTLVGSIYPMVGDMLGGMLSDLSSLGVKGIVKSPDSTAAARLNLAELAGLSGYLDLYLDGERDTKKLVDVFENLGLYIYPQSFAKKLPNDATHSKLINDLRAAKLDWTYFDRINPTIDGVAREGYNDGKVDALDFTGYKWEVNNYNSFVSAVGIVFEPLLPLLRTLLTGTDYSQTVVNLAYGKGANITIPDAIGSIDVTISSVEARINATLSIVGKTVFKDLWIPVMEALGVTDSGYDLSALGINGTYSFKSLSASSTSAQMADALFSPLLVVIEQLKRQPLNKILDILPQLVYTLSFDVIQSLIDDVEINIAASFAINEVYNLEIIEIFGWSPNLASLGNTFKSTINGFLPSFDFNFALADLVNLEEMLGFEYTNINTLLAFVLDSLGLGVSLPIINAGEIITCGVGNANYPSAGGNGKRIKIVSDKADILYFLLTYLVNAIGNQEFVDGIFDFIAYSSAEKTLDTDNDGVADTPTEEAVEAAKLTGPIIDLLNVVIANASSDPDGVLAALVELFVPQRYKTEAIDWKESRYNYGGIEGANAATLMYLDYSNDWTKEKATYLIENIDALVSSVLKMAGQEEVEVNALIQDKFDELFSNINITGLVKAVSSLGTALGDNDIIYSMLDDLGADFKSIYNAFGYLFVTDLDRLEEGFTEPLKPGDNGYNNPFKFEPYEVTYEEVTELNESGEEVTVIEKDENGQPILDGEGNPIVRKKVNVIWKYDGVVFDEEAENAKEIFVDILCETLAGFSGLLGAFFRGDSVGLFNDSIEILGYPNYADSIGLFFEILGIEGVMDQDEYAAYCAANGDTAALSFTVKQLFNWVDGYLLTGNTIQKIIELVPNLIYFVESNGLSVVLHNLLMPVLVLIDTVRPILDVNLNGLVSAIVSDLVNGKSFSLDSILALLTGTAAAAEDEDYKYISIDVGKLTITEIVKILDAILGTDLAGSQLGTYGIPGFCSGIEEYESVVSGGKAKRSTVDAPDAITILISALLEAVEFETESGETNGEILCDLIQGMMEDDSVDVKAIYTSVIDLIKGVKVEYQTPNWGYMFETPDEFSVILPAHTINYLDYSTDWTEDKAIAIEKTFDEVVDYILEAATKEEDATIAKLLQGVFNDNVYTDANLTMMVEGIVNLIAGLDETLRNTIDTVIDTDIASWFEMCDAVEGVDEDGNATVTYKVKADKDWGVDSAAEEDKREMFVTGLYEVLMPAQRLISWFLFGDDFAFFTGTEKNEDGSYKYNDIITLTGGRAYDYALVPILEALGIEMPVADTFYITDADGNGTYNVGLAIDSILESVFNLIDEVSANPTKGVLDLLVNLLYFINADGIKTSVNNILAPIDALIAKVSPLIEDLNGATSIAEILDTMVPALDGIDISDLTMENILGIINEKTGLVMSKEMVDILLTFYVGKLQQFDSANGNDAYRMVYTDEECYHDMLTIVLAFAIDLVKQNGPVITELLGENGAEIYAAINALLTPYTVTYQDIDWGYMYEAGSVEADNAALAEAGKFKAVTKFQYLKYATDWTEEKAKAVYAQLDDVIAYALGELAGESSIAALLQGVMEDKVYTEKNLKTVVELIVNALAGLDKSLANTIGIVVDADISTWFSFCEEQEVDGETKYVCTKEWGVDEASDKKAVFVAAVKEILQPANRLLSWFFFEDTFTFFKDATKETLITINGGRGYDEALVPIFEALGCKLQPAAAYYNDETKTYDVDEAVEDILDSALELVDKVSENPSAEVMALIPNLLYFINADGLVASVNNLLAPVEALFGVVAPLLGDVAGDAETLAELLNDLAGVEISNLNTENVLALLEEKAGFVMNEDMKDVIRNIYALGEAAEFASVNGETAYRVDVADKEYDVLTVLLSFAIDAFKLNKPLFEDLLPEGVYDAIVELVAGLEITVAEINWAYMYSGNMEELERSGFPATKLTYLEYATDWTETAADSVYSVLDEVLELVLPMVIEDGDLKKLVTDLIEGNLYKTENLETIVELIVNLLADFDESLRNVVDAVLDVNIASWFAMCQVNADGEYEVIPGTLSGDNKEDFIAGLKTVLQPANELLSWLFFGTSYTFFNGTTSEVLITVNGGNGYAYGLVPILEALGLTMKPADDYKTADGKYNVGAAVEDIINAVLSIVDELGAAESTVEYVFTLLPNLLYFINADGLNACVSNLVAPVDAIIGCLSDVVGAENIAALLTTAIGFDISKLGTADLLALLEEKTGFAVNDEMKDAIYKIYAVGDAQKFTSANGKTAYAIDPDMGDVLTVVLSFAVDAFNLNRDLFADLMGEDKYDAVYNLIRGAKEQFVYAEPNWGYMYEGGTAELVENNGKMPKYPENSTAANYLLYQNNWNKETAKYVNEVVDAVVAGIMGETTLGQMLDDAITNGFYRDSILNSLISLVVGFVVDYAEIIEGAGVLLGAESISKWFDYCTVDANGNVTVTHDFGVDEAATNDEKREKFVEAFVDVLEPAYQLLAWLLFDQEFTFLNGTTNDPLITLTGGRGYEEALVPLFEAVGAKMPGLEDKKYENGETAMRPAAYYELRDKATGEITGYNMEAVVRDLFSALTGWLSQICGDLANQGEYGVIGAMLDLLPNVIYNINAGTVKAVVQNLLLPVEEILGHLEAFGLTVDFSSLIEIRGKALDIKNLDWYAVFDIVETLGLYWPDKIQDFLATLYIGEAVEFKSANGKTAYYMTYNADDEGDYLVSGREDMITLIVSFVIDGVLDKRNEARLSGWLGADVYKVIYSYLANEIVKVPMKDVDWKLTEYADTDTVVSPITLGAKINSEFYGELYTREMGEYIEKWLPSFVDSMIVLLGVQSADGTNYEGLSDILNELIGTSLYTKENLDKILDLIKGLLPKAEEALGAELFEVVVNVLDKALGIDLTYWDNYTVADIETGDRDAFVDELTRMLTPLYPVLRWLLTDEDLVALFYTAEGRDAVVIEGAEGYAYGIIPLLEAFDYDSEKILTPEEFKAASTDAPAMLKNILNPVLDVVDTVLADPVNEIFNVLPGVIYFLNSNGLDTVIKNTANAVFTVLENIEPLTGEIDIYELIGFDAENINIETLISELIKGLEEDTGFQLTEVAMEALKELTVGTVISFTSKNGKTAYTVEYATGADRVDMVTVILRTVLTFVSIPENVVALEGMLEGKLNEDGYKFLCSLLENFSQMAAKTDENGNKTGMDEIMYTVYQIFYAANVAAHSTEDWLAEFNGDYSFLNELFKTSNLDFLRQIEISLGDLLNKYTGDIIDDNEIAPNGLIAFFQKIVEFFQKIGDFFKNLFK
ncbi:MAG: hypothetical protein IJN70_05920 [Clostridia bacterium]|nr:hypothetical protein [Clostridia bacterium]